MSVLQKRFKSPQYGGQTFLSGAIDSFFNGLFVEDFLMMRSELGRRDFLLATAAGTVAAGLENIAMSADDPADSEGKPKVKVGVLTHDGGAHLTLYFQALKRADEVATVVLADPDGTSEADARKILGDKLTAVYRTYEELLANEQPALALISVEAKRGPAIIRQALEANCHVLAEKPACVRAEDFEPLVSLAESQKRHLMLALANRLNPEVQEAKRLIAAGELGQVYGVEMNLIQDQTRLTKPSYQESWFAKKDRAGGGHLTWLGIHWLDLSMFLTGSDITQVTGFVGNVGGANIEVEDSVAVAFRYANGTFGTLTSGYYLDTGYQSHLKIWGSKGWLVIDSSDNPSLRCYRAGVTKSAEGEVLASRGSHDAYSVFVRAAARASAGFEDAPITGREALRVLRTVYGAYRAAAGGCAVDV